MFKTLKTVISEVKPKDLIRKTVQFTYLGGSSDGLRTVRVEKVFCLKKCWFIEGYDLEKPDLHEGYRRYSAAKIYGQIRILN